MSFEQFVARQMYGKVNGLGDRLEVMRHQIDWERFRPIIASVFFDDEKTGGRPHTDEVVIVRAMVLQACYSLSDQELEFQIHDRLSFRNFLGFPEHIPDFSTFWKTRERLKEAGKEGPIWSELQRQLDAKGYELQKGVIQDACFIDAPQGRRRKHLEKKARKKGETVAYTEKQLSHIDKDGTYSIKQGQVHYGYKDHIKMDVGCQIVRSYEVTTASLHDGQVDLVKKGDETAYRDKGYFGKRLACGDVKDMTMKRATRGRKLNGGELKRNRAISRIRAIGERPIAVVKNVFHAGSTLVKTLERVSLKEMFKWFAYDLYQLVTLEKKKLAIAP
jgi:transposase, IS5 family